MIILKSTLHKTIWGGNRLSHYYGEENLNETVGHLYLVNGHKNECSTAIMNGKYKGKLLCDCFEEIKHSWGLEDFKEFPLTIALVDATNDLSIQVHPDDKTAERLEGLKIGKTESWFFLEKPTKGWIYAGCLLSNKEDLIDAVRNGEMENITAQLPVERGDYVCVHSGTLHAMTAGSLVYEIEYGGDYTYRFYDFDRKDKNGNNRELHIEKALESIDTNAMARNVHMQEGIWISEQYYKICLTTVDYIYRNAGNEIECIVLLSGRFRIEGQIANLGISVLLFPGEEIEFDSESKIIIAELVR